jgi:uncharacterized membrane protein (DUF2068 family)
VLPARPTGIALIAAWHFVSALLLLIVGLREFGTAIPNWPDMQVGGIAPFYLVAVPLNLILGAGLWELARWARYLAIVTSILAIVLRFIGGSPPLTDILLALVSAATIAYLLKPSTRQLFERATDKADSTVS